MPTSDEIRHYEARLAREPTSQTYAALAEAHRRAGQPEEAIRLCRDGLARFPEYSTTRLILAKALLDRGEVAEARREIGQFVETEPGHEPALRLGVECALRVGDPGTALGYLRRLVTLDPRDRAAQGQARALEVAAGRRPETAEGGLWPLLEDDTFATVTFGDLCVAQGLADEATAVFGRILFRQPDHEMAKARLAELARRGPGRRPRG